MQIYWDYKRMRLLEKRSQLAEDYFGTLTWPPFHCFGTSINIVAMKSCENALKREMCIGVYTGEQKTSHSRTPA